MMVRLVGPHEFISVNSVRHKIVVFHAKTGKLRTGKNTTYHKVEN